MNEKGILSAIAELLDIDEDILDRIDPEIGEDNGSSSDEWHYGYYCSIPELSELKEDFQEELKVYPKVDNIPFGRTEYYTDGQLSNTKADPFGSRADYEYEQYEKKIELYALNHPATKEETIKALNEILVKINTTDDEVISKSLVMFSFSIVDGFTKSFIWNLIKNTAPTTNSEINELYENIITKKLENHDGRDGLYKILKHHKLTPIPFYTPIRHLLAHDVGKITIEDNCISFIDSSKTKQKHRIDVIFGKMIEYINSL